jgi:uncharacterized membrane protein
MKKNKLSNLFYIVFSILFYILLINDLRLKLTTECITSNKYYIYFTIAAIIIFIVMCGLVIIIKKSNKKEHIIFAILASVLGAFYLFLSPMFTGSDEHNHYYRIYEITEGKMISTIHNKDGKLIIGSKLPSSLYLAFSDDNKEYIDRNIFIKYYDQKKMMQKKLNKEKTEDYGSVFVKEYNNTALYSPLQYIPEVIGFSIGKTLNLGPFYLGILGRLFNLLFFILICTYFLKKLPKYKKFAMVVLLSPTVLCSATTLSADGFTIAIIFGFISYILYNINEKRSLTKKDRTIYIVLSILIASCKIVYLPLIALLLLLLSKEKYKSKKDKIIFTCICLLIGTIIGLVWIKITDRFFDVYYLNTAIQKENIIRKPFWYITVLLKTYISKFSHLLFNIFGGTDLYHGQLDVYNIVSVMYLLVAGCAFFYEKNNDKNSKLKNLYISSIILIIIILISTAIYIQCTANFIGINNSIIEVLQGRYFVPLVLCMLFFDNGIIKLNFSDKNNTIIKSVLMINYFVLLQMIVHFII